MFKKILPLLLFALSFIFFSQAFAEEVVCECSPKTVNVGEVVSCNAYFQGEGNPPCDWVIDWGDGSSGGARTHAYSKSGTYTIRCIAKFKGIWCGQGSTTITQVVTVKPQRSCSDSDGGINPAVKGKVILKEDGKEVATAEDYCYSSTQLVERFCQDSNNIGFQIISCSGECKEGVCTQAPTPSVSLSGPSSANINEDFKLNYNSNIPRENVGAIVLFRDGTKIQTDYVCTYATSVCQGVLYEKHSKTGTYSYQVKIYDKNNNLLATSNIHKVQVVEGTTPSPTVTISNVIPSPNPFSTSTRFQVITQPSNTPVDKLEIKIFDLSGKQVATLSDSNTTGINWDGDNLANGAYLYVANVTHQGKSYGPFKDKVVIQRGGGGGITITSFTANPQSGNAPLNVTFTLSASSPKGLKGIIWYFGDGNTATTDISGNPTSYTGSASWTYQNAGTFSAYAKVKDSAGNTATSSTVQISVSSGQGPTPSGCTDSDGGKNYYQKGVVTTAGGSVQLPDFCDNDTVLIEHFCKDNVNPGWERYNCPNGCQDGACKGAQPSPQPQPQPQPSSTISCNPQNPKVGEQVICQVTPKGQNPCRFYFNWGDGKEDTLTSPQGIHTYQSPGTYTLTVTIRYQWLLNTCPVFNSEKVTSKIEVSSGEEVTPKFTVSLSGPTTARENSSFRLEYASNIPKWDVGAISLLKDGQEVARETYYKCTIANFNECTGYLYRKESVAGIYSYQVKMYDRNNNLLATSNIHKVQVGEVTPTPTPTPTPVPTEPVLNVSPSATKVDFQIKGKDLIVADFYIFDLTGKAIAEKLNVLPNEAKEEILWSWDLTDKEGKSVRSGLYLYKVKLKYANNTKDFEGRFAVEREAPTEVGASNWLVRLWKTITEFFKVFKF